MSNNISDQFSQVLEELNPRQRQAVDLIDGPVMVIAGPGTGKTQLLAARIGNILLQTDTRPEEILCMTFTDAGAINMRNRLRKLIGPTAFRIPIYTFHGFCNAVMMSHREDFPQFTRLSPINDLERRELMEDILASLPSDHIFYKVKGQDNYTIANLFSYIDTIKKENYDPDELQKALHQEFQDNLDEGAFDYKRTGEINPNKYEPAKKKLITATAALQIYKKYTDQLSQKSYYDYIDMIIWVIEKMKSDDIFLGSLQEKYQYILVDEYQDTNGSQNQLVSLLASYWDSPNLFVVGDDDQSIFKFQGANTENIVDFQNKYDPAIIILEQNYRSTPGILAAAQALIEHNKERLIHQLPGVEKNLISSNKDFVNIDTLPVHIQFDDDISESAWVHNKLKERYRSGGTLSDVAVIYSRHIQADMLIDSLGKDGIPFQIKKSENLFNTPLFYQLHTILLYLQEEGERPGLGDHRLFEILHYDCFELSSSDIAMLNYQIRAINKSDNDRRVSWRAALCDPELIEAAGIKESNRYIDIGLALDGLISKLFNHTVQTFFDAVLHDLGLWDHILAHPQRNFLLQIVKSFFSFLKDESEKEDKMLLSDFLATIRKYEEYNISIPVLLTIGVSHGVNFLTAHGAKGLEFDEVFVIGAIENYWANKRGKHSYALPTAQKEKANDFSIEEKRRLFFVAMTRAKTKLWICSFDQIDGKAKNQVPFLDEISSSARIQEQKQESQLSDLDYFALQHSPQELQNPDIIDPDLVDRHIETMAMSVTALNKYRECGLKYYFENILRVPAARNKHMGFGNVAHKSLENIYDLRAKQAISESDIQKIFSQSLDYFASHFTQAEQDRIALWGKTEFMEFVLSRLEDYDQVKSHETEYRVSDIDIDGVPVTGNIDLLKIHDHNKASVIDYKTGNVDKSDMKSSLSGGTNKGEGGKYWRQMVFYKLLLDADTKNNYILKEGYFDFVEKSKIQNDFIKKHVNITLEDEAKVKDQLQKAYLGIKAHELSHQCNECKWCSFIENKSLPLQYDLEPEPEESI